MPAREDEDVRRWETCGDAWIGVLRHVWTAGEAGLEDGGPIIEGPPLLFEVSALSWEDPVLHEHGDHARLVRRAQERTRRVVRGRYWPRLHDLQGKDQIRWVVAARRTAAGVRGRSPRARRRRRAGRVRAGVRPRTERRVRNPAA